MKIGIITRQDLDQDQTVTASTLLEDVTGFSAAVKANVLYHYFLHLPFDVGAAGGFKFFLDTPLAPAYYINTQIAVDMQTTPPVFFAAQTIFNPVSSFAAVAAVSGTHLATMRGEIIPSIDGILKLQFACNSAAGAITLWKGSYFELITF